MIKFIKEHLFAFKFFAALSCLISALILEKTVKDINEFVILGITIFGYLIISYDLYIEAVEGIKNKHFFTEDTLTIIASIASICIGECIDGLAVVIFFQLGEFFEDYAMSNSRKSIESILSLRPSVVHLNNGKKIVDIDPNKVRVGDTFIVNPGEIVPIDGIIIEGISSINTSSITGESLPVDANVGDKILSGVIVIQSPLRIRAEKEYNNSTVAKILDIIENANDKKTSSEKFITKFAKIYTPIVIALAFSIAILPPLFIGLFNNDWSVWSEWIYRGASMLVISCPCALVISIPMSYVVSIGVASKNKIIVKGTTYLELLAKANSVYLDKTGTITEGNFIIEKLNNESHTTVEEILKLAKIAESHSTHPIAKAVIGDEKIEEKATHYTEVSGKGITCFYKNKLLKVGNTSLFKRDEIKEIDETGTVLYVVYNDKFLGSIVIKDQIKSIAREAIKGLYKNGIRNITMMTGDNGKVAEEVSRKVGIKNWKHDLLPIHKTSFIEKANNNGEITIFVGDGVNDAPSMIMANIGISMGQIGSDSAIEASDIVIMDDNLKRINFLLELSKINRFVVYWNISFSILAKIAAIILNSFGIFQQYAILIAILADVGVTIVCCINSLLISLKKK